ncbi:MAG: PAS domain S-box protein [Chitinophagaceae bacterium]
MQNERQLLRTIIDNIPINVYVKDTNSRKVLVNKSEILYMNMDESEILGKSDVELYPYDSAKVSIEEDQMVMKQHIPILDKETFNFKFDGGESWYLTSKIPLYDEKNECIGLLGISHNISERKAMEQKLQTALNNLQNILDATNQVSIIGTDIYGTITIFNKGAEKLLGYSADEVLHKNTPGIFHKLEEVQKRSEELSAEFGETIEGFQVFVHFAKQNDYESREWTYTRKDGTTFPVQLVITVLKDVEGNITGYLGVAVDITTLKNSQIALKQSELQFRALFELSPIGIVLIDYSTGNFLDVNNSFTNTIGYSKNEILEKNFWNIISSDNKQLQKTIVSTIRDTGLYGPIEGMCSKKNQTKFPVLLNGVQIADTYGKTLLWSVIQDISYIKEKENELNNLNKEIERRNIALQISNEELEQFAYIASHDLQEPLRMISGFLTKLEKKYKNQLDENALQYIFFAVDGAARMRNLITDLLAYSRAGKVDYKTEIVSFEQILTNVVTLLRSQIEEKNAEITWGEMPILRVAKTPIQQLFSNLISNGLKYQKENNIPKINIVAFELEKHWQFSITDNGIGIEPQYFEKVFAIFQRLHNKGQYSGTGIGLAICKKIATYHHGEIWLESFPNLGTTFFVTISKEIT